MRSPLFCIVLSEGRCGDLEKFWRRGCVGRIEEVGGSRVPVGKVTNKVVSVGVSLLEECELFLNSVEMCNVYRQYSGFLVKGEGGPKIVPLRSKGEAKCPILDPL